MTVPLQEGEGQPAAALSCLGYGSPLGITVIQKRRDFLAAARAKRQARPSMVVQARKRKADEPSISPVRVGYTCSKKVGNAVARNRAKRRLREAARLILPEHAKSGWDYVLIGRRDGTAERDFQQMLDDLRSALARLHT